MKKVELTIMVPDYFYMPALVGTLEGFVDQLKVLKIKEVKIKPTNP